MWRGTKESNGFQPAATSAARVPGAGPRPTSVVDSATEGASAHGSSGYREKGLRGSGERTPARPFLDRLSRFQPRGGLPGHGGDPRGEGSARRASDRPQDRLHQSDHLGRIRRPRADLGLCLRQHGPGPGSEALEVSLERSAPNPASSRRSCSASRLRPRPDMDAQALIRCIDWIAHGFEIVQSIFPNWSFRPPDTVAAYGLHGRLFIGPRHSAESRRDEWARELSRFEIDLFRNGASVDHGVAANVLDGPLFALRHLAGTTLAHDRLSPPLAAGEIVNDGNADARLSRCGGRRMDHEAGGVRSKGRRIRVHGSMTPARSPAAGNQTRSRSVDHRRGTKQKRGNREPDRFSIDRNKSK